MSQQLNIDFSVLRKIIMLALCLFLVFSLVLRPMTVQASATAVVAVGAAGSVAMVAAYLVPVILLCVAVGVYWDDIQDLVDRATDIYNTASAEVKAWFQNVGDKYLSGSSTVSLPGYIKDIFSNLGNALFPALAGNWLILIAADRLRDISRVNSQDVLAETYLESISETNSLLSGIYDVISGVRSAVSAIPSYFAELADQINFMISETGIRMQEYAVALAGLSDAIDYRIDQLTYYVRTEILYTIREGSVGVGNIQDLLDNLTGYLRTEVIDNIRGASANVIEKIKSIPGQLDSLTGYLRTEVLENIRTTSANVVSNVVDGVTGIVNGLVSLGDRIVSKLQSLIDTVVSIPNRIIEALSTASWIKELLSSAPIELIKNFFTSVWSWVDGIVDFFSPSGDDEDRIPFFDFLLGRNDGSTIWDSFTDNTFVNALHGFYDFVSALWLTFPLFIRYLLIFGFCFPFMFSIFKLFAG